MQDKFDFNCPKCNAVVRAPITAGGKGATCPKCDQPIIIPKITDPAESELALEKPIADIPTPERRFQNPPPRNETSGILPAVDFPPIGAGFEKPAMPVPIKFPDEIQIQEPLRVLVVDFEMSFISMIIFMVKWAIAAIPALILLVAFGFLCSAFFLAILSAMASK